MPIIHFSRLKHNSVIALKPLSKSENIKKKMLKTSKGLAPGLARGRLCGKSPVMSTSHPQKPVSAEPSPVCHYLACGHLQKCDTRVVCGPGCLPAWQLHGTIVPPPPYPTPCFCQNCIQVHQIAMCELSADDHVYIIFNVQKKFFVM